MGGDEEARRQVEDVIQRWKTAMEVQDVERRAAQWDQQYPSPIFMFEDVEEPLRDWAAIRKYYTQMPALDWALRGLSTGVAGDLAYAFCNFSVEADIDWEQPGFYVREPSAKARVFDGRITFVLRNSHGTWKIVHYHESLSRDNSYKAWSYLWS